MSDFDDPMGAGIAALATVLMIAVVPLGILCIAAFLVARATASRYGLLAAAATTLLMLGLVGGVSLAVAHLSPKFAELPALSKVLSSLWVCSVALMFLAGILRSMAALHEAKKDAWLEAVLWCALLSSLILFILTDMTLRSFITRWFWHGVAGFILLVWVSALARRVFKKTSPSSTRDRDTFGPA